MSEESTRTRLIREAKVDEDMPFIKKAVQAVTLGASRLMDKAGLTQEKEYQNKSKEELIKKRSGGYVRSADGCAQRGKTRGRIV